MNNSPADYFSALRKYEIDATDTIIRRYLTEEKFVRFVQDWQLRFAPASTFTGDPEEGFFTLKDQSDREARLKQMRFCDRGLNIAREAWDRVCTINAKSVVISCWTKGPSECFRMWEEYGESNRAVAIETTLGELSAVLGSEMIAAPVQYVDRENARLPETHSIEPFLYKGTDFAWERELRFITHMEIGRQIGTPRYFPVPPDKVAFKLILAPGADRQRQVEVAGMLGEYVGKVHIRQSVL